MPVTSRLVAIMMLAFACGTARVVADDAAPIDSGDVADVADAGEAESEGRIITFAENSGDCGTWLDSWRPNIEVGCCDGVPCNGVCLVVEHVEASVCGCSGFLRGCQAGTVCCQPFGQCTSPGACPLPN